MDQIQKSILDKDYLRAIDLLSAILRKQEIPTVLCTRAMCKWEAQQLESCKIDALRVLEIDDVKTAYELFPGCYSTHAMSYVLLTKIFTKTNDFESKSKYAKLATECIKQQTSDMDKAVEIKLLGNKLFASGKTVRALEMYESALKLDPTNTSVLSNAAHMLFLLGRLDEAQTYARDCTVVDPDFSKGWYRRGTIALKKKNYEECLHSYMKASELSPKEYKSLYIDTMKSITNIKASNGGIDTHFIGMMSELLKNSWDFRRWYADSKEKVLIWPLEGDNTDKWWESNSALNLSEMDTRFIRKVFQLKQLTLPSINKLADLVIPDEPLMTLSVLHHVLSKTWINEAKEWSIVWTFQGENDTPFGFLVNEERSIIFDTALYTTSRAQLLSFIKKVQHDQRNLYTCENEAVFFELVESFHKNSNKRAVKEKEVNVVEELNDVLKQKNDEMVDEEEVQAEFPLATSTPSKSKTVPNLFALSQSEWIMLLLLPVAYTLYSCIN